MRARWLILFLLLYSNIYSQNNSRDSLLLSFLSSDSVLFKANLSFKNSDTLITIYVKNISHENIYIDTIWIRPGTWHYANSKNKNPIGVEFTDLEKNDVDEGNLKVFKLKPNNYIKLTYNIRIFLFEEKFDDVRFYSFEFRYLLEKNISSELIGVDNFKIPKITYYFLSKHILIGNYDVEELLE